MSNNTSATGDARFYVYALVRPCGTPFYIGKGSGKRHRDHLKESQRGGASLKCKLIRKLADEGTPAKSIILQSGLTSNDAFALEEELIARYGRMDMGTGILANHTDGGDGVHGHSPETIEKLRASTKRQMTPEAREYLSELAKRQFEDPDMRKKVSDACKLGQNRPDRIAANRERGLARLRDNPSERERLAAVSKAYNSTDEAKKANSESKRRQWQDPEYRERTIAAQNAGRARSRLAAMNA